MESFVKSRSIHDAGQMEWIDYNKKIKVVSTKPHSDVGKPKPNPTLGKPNPNPQQVHLHEKDDPTEDQIPEVPTHAMVHECLENPQEDQHCWN